MARVFMLTHEHRGLLRSCVKEAYVLVDLRGFLVITDPYGVCVLPSQRLEAIAC